MLPPGCLHSMTTRLKAGLLAQVNAFCVALIEHLTVAPKILGFSPSNSQGNNIFAAAMSDLSPLWVGARCEGTMNASNCNGSGGCINCAGPACPDEEVCGTCFNVKCTGSLDGETSGSCSGNTIKVKIIDACPATHPENYCKIAQFGGNIRPQEACEASGVNALDIATTARSSLSSFQGNLNIDIESTSC